MRNFENTLKHIIWKHFETYVRFLKTLWNTLFENTLKHIIWKHFETYEEFWKHFETHNLKTLWNLWEIFENTLKHIIWKHFETHYLKTVWNTLFENHIDTPLSYHHLGVTIETLGFQLALKWNTYVQSCTERKSAFSCCWKYRLHNYRVKQ